ncbi:hypothetical protein MACK_001429 [Theileria orientalis]|uniref:Uncharacterized protein n=1 Tax=Theileria orientalis TaxID=68886 RepID=A0A976MEJ3_THEOR|nr:hypothetical protein MACK_001429 [Theileria orientalis]
MNSHPLNITKSNEFYTHTKILKETLHFKFVKYLDIFCIIWLILNKRLKVFNYRSYKALIDRLNVVCNNKIENSETSRDLILDYINNSSFHEVIAAFISNIESKFNFNKRKQSRLESLSYEDFELCNLVLGRDPFGLYSVVKKCMCAFNSTNQKGVDVKSELKNLSEKWREYRVLECTNCLNTEDRDSLVGVVVPFVLSNHRDYLYEHSDVQKKRKISDNVSKDYRPFELNQKLYSSTLKYPLEHLMGGPERWYDGRDENQSGHLSDLVFELVSLMLDQKGDNVISEEIHSLASIIKGNISGENLEDYSKDGSSDYCMFYTDAMSKLLDEYGKMLEQVVKFKPFPTTYWLINKNLITRMSKLESDGMIKVIQNSIDEQIKEYDKQGKGGNNEKFVRNIIEDNLSYLIRRYKLTHPTLIEVLYNIIFNSNLFTTTMEEGSLNRRIQYVRLDESRGKRKKTQQNKILFKGLSILNTLRIHGIGGSKDFLHIKCLHTNLAYEISEGSYIGSFVSKLI